MRRAGRAAQRADVLRRGPPLRARARRRARPGDDHAVRGRARRRASSGRSRTAEFPPSVDPHPRAATSRCGSCSAPAASPRRTSRRTRCARTRTRDGPRGRRAARRSPSGCASSRRTEWPHALLLLGDQVYADEVSPESALHPCDATPRCRRASRSADFDEYTQPLPRRRGASPTIRWLLSTVPSAMIFDDHDVHDDWNTSIDLGRRRCARKAWWDERDRRRRSMSYWIYQHLGNLSPRRAAPTIELYARVRDGRRRRRRSCATSRQAPTARSRARAGASAATSAPARLVMIDSRAGRVLDARRARDGRRATSGTGSRSTRTGDCRPPADRHVAAAAARARRCTTSRPGTRRSATAPGAGRPRASARSCARALDLEHWPAFGGVASSACASCCARSAPASGASRPRRSCVLSGDVHHAYLAEVGFPPGTGVRSSRLAGGLLAVPQPARHERAARDPAPPGPAPPARVDARARARAPGVRATAACAGGSRTTSRGSTTRSRWLELDGPTRRFVLEKSAARPRRTEPSEPRAWSAVFERSIEPNARASRRRLRHVLRAGVIIR